MSGLRNGVISILLALVAPLSLAAPQGVMLMNRIGPSVIDLFVANSDGSNEHKLFTDSDFDYNASFSADGQWIVFTSERAGYGQADIYRAHTDGSGLERLTDYPGVDDQASFAPDGRRIAFMSSRAPDKKANIYILDVATKQARCLTCGTDLQVTDGQPDGFFRPAWSPDGAWIAFSSDRLTHWAGHEAGAGAGHSQITSVYIIHPDGTGLKRLTDGSAAAGTPQWSRDSTHVLCYQAPPPAAPGAVPPPGQAQGVANTQIISIDIASGERTELTSGPGAKVKPQMLPDGRVGYLLKALPRNTAGSPGIFYTDGSKATQGMVRAPAWSADGKLMVYERQNFAARPQGQPLYSWDPRYQYRYTDVFPMFSSRHQLVTTDLSSLMGNPQTSISTWGADGYSNHKRVFWDPNGSAMDAAWSPDGRQLVFGFGAFFNGRNARPAVIRLMNADGSNVRNLTEGLPNAGFPSFSPDGKYVVFRVWGKDANGIEQRGLRLLKLADRSVTVLSTEWDNFPYYSPDGKTLLFTRQQKEDRDFEIYTMKPDGTGVRRLLASPGTDGHATWTADGKHIFFMSTRVGFKDERLMYDNSPQPYAQIFIMDTDGTHIRQLTESRWEDSMPAYVPQAGY